MSWAEAEVHPAATKIRKAEALLTIALLLLNYSNSELAMILAFSAVNLLMS
jgi:hypothetical protein